MITTNLVEASDILHWSHVQDEEPIRQRLEKQSRESELADCCRDMQCLDCHCSC